MPLMAQERENSRFDFGLRGGLNFVKVNFRPSIQQSLYQGPCLGGVARYQNETWVSLQLELMYSEKGWHEDLDGEGEYYTRHFQTLELPLLSSFHITTSPQSRINVNVGPQLSYTFSDRESKHLVSTPSKPHYGSTLDKDLLFMLSFGLAYEFTTGMGDFLLDARYTFSFSDFFDNKKADIFQNSQFDYFAVSLVYMLDFKKKK